MKSIYILHMKDRISLIRSIIERRRAEKATIEADISSADDISVLTEENEPSDEQAETVELEVVENESGEEVRRPVIGFFGCVIFEVREREPVYACEDDSESWISAEFS